MLKIGSSRISGRGVFAMKNFNKGEMIETVPVIVLSHKERVHVVSTLLGEYIFNWRDRKECAIALGYGSLYNHSYTPNAVFTKNIDQLTIEFTALRDIQSGEEITVNYNGDPNDHSPVWFSVIQ